MPHISYKKLWENEIDNIVSKRDEVQDINFNHLKLEVHDSFKKDEKKSTTFEPSDDTDVINKPYLQKNLSKIECHLSILEKVYNEIKILSNKQCTEEVLIQRAVKTTIQIPYDEGFFDNFPNADEILKDLLFVKRRRTDSEKIKDVIQ